MREERKDMGNVEVSLATTDKKVTFVPKAPQELQQMIEKVNALARERQCGKILCKTPEWALETLLDKGFEEEARIPGLFKGETGYFLSEFPDSHRKSCTDQQLKILKSVRTIALASSKKAGNEEYNLPGEFQLAILGKENLHELTSHYLFSLKPDLTKEELYTYLSERMESSTEFYGIYRGSELIETAQVELDHKALSAEIMHLATSPDYRGRNLSYHLVREIRNSIFERDFQTLYASIRASSYGLNITFGKQGFELAGTLKNNTVLGGVMECMNVWYLN